MRSAVGAGRRVVAGVTAVTALATAAACSDGAAPERKPGPPPAVELGFTQLLPKAGTRDALLRVVNTGPTDLPVTGAGLAWSGYGGALVAEQDIVLPPGATRDLRVRLPAPRCDAGDEPVRGTVRSDGREVTRRLTRFGEVFVRRLWERQCGVRLVDRTVRVEYGDRWTQAGPDSAALATGTLRLTRVGGDAEVEVVGVDGSVLHDLRLPSPGRLSRLDGDADQVAVPLQVLPGNRCDEHARGQATAPYDFLVRLRIDRTTEVTVAPPVPLALQEAATRALDRACGGPVRSAGG
ncbi:MAG TPA: hypothetical protein VFV40_02690 [Nocardioides sp.]|nr:hypothetical protein [Nocardioides sp.]